MCLTLIAKALYYLPYLNTATQVTFSSPWGAHVTPTVQPAALAWSLGAHYPKALLAHPLSAKQPTLCTVP